MSNNIHEMYLEAKKDISVSCDENHAHSALTDCLVGDKHAINVCKLYEKILLLQDPVFKLNKILDVIR